MEKNIFKNSTELIKEIKAKENFSNYIYNI